MKSSFLLEIIPLVSTPVVVWVQTLVNIIQLCFWFLNNDLVGQLSHDIFKCFPDLVATYIRRSPGHLIVFHCQLMKIFDHALWRTPLSVSGTPWRKSPRSGKNLSPYKQVSINGSAIWIRNYPSCLNPLTIILPTCCHFTLSYIVMKKGIVAVRRTR